VAEWAVIVTQVVSFNIGNVKKWHPFSLLPSNARVQAGIPPAGRPNYFTGTAMPNALVYTDRIQVWRFHVDWTTPAYSTFTGPTDSMTGSTWSGPPSTVPEPSPGNNLDTLAIRLMMQNQYSKVGSVESLWDSHTVAGGL